MLDHFARLGRRDGGANLVLRDHQRGHVVVPVVRIGVVQKLDLILGVGSLAEQRLHEATPSLFRFRLLLQFRRLKQHRY